MLTVPNLTVTKLSNSVIHILDANYNSTGAKKKITVCIVNCNNILVGRNY